METIDCTPTWHATLTIVKNAAEMNPKNQELQDNYNKTLAQMTNICEKVRLADPDARIGDIFKRLKYKMPDALTCGYWVGRQITLPPMNFQDWEEISEKELGVLMALVGQPVKILNINNNPEDPVNELYVIIEAYEIPFNFGQWYPIEIARVLNHAGENHFGEEIPLEEHPHFNL